MRSSALRVLCVDDNEMVGDALRQRLTREPGLEWAGLVQTASTALDHIRQSKPDIVLLDIDMPGADVFDIVERAAVELPAVRIVMFSGHIDPGYIARALDAGAWGYLSKNDDVSSLIMALRRVARGEIVQSPEVDRVRSLPM